MITAFQRSAFQNNAFQIDVSGAVTTPVAKRDAGGAARKRRKILIGERSYNVADSELPDLLRVLLTRPEPTHAPLEKQAKPGSGLAPSTTSNVEAPAAPVAYEDLAPWIARYQALAEQFRADAAAMVALEEARRRIEMENAEDEAEVELLLLNL